VNLGNEIRQLLLVALGAIPGALLRWQAVVQLAPVLPFATAGADLVVNLIGAALLGYLVAPPAIAPGLLLALGIGFCGSLTTFSSWMLDMALLQHQGQHLQALLVLLLSFCLGLMAAASGYSLSARVRRQR
jgi:CrcB protein